MAIGLGPDNCWEEIGDCEELVVLVLVFPVSRDAAPPVTVVVRCANETIALDVFVDLPASDQRLRRCVKKQRNSRLWRGCFVARDLRPVGNKDGPPLFEQSGESYYDIRINYSIQHHHRLFASQTVLDRQVVRAGREIFVHIYGRPVVVHPICAGINFLRELPNDRAV